ncbi:MAG: hypothetical protein QM722_00265 [Piscinibacter sp.]
MDPLYLLGFGPRTPEAARDLMVASGSRAAKSSAVPVPRRATEVAALFAERRRRVALAVAVLARGGSRGSPCCRSAPARSRIPPARVVAVLRRLDRRRSPRSSAAATALVSSRHPPAAAAPRRDDRRGARPSPAR